VLARVIRKIMKKNQDFLFLKKEGGGGGF